MKSDNVTNVKATQAARSPKAFEDYGRMISFNEDFDLGIPRSWSDETTSICSMHCIEENSSLRSAVSSTCADSSTIFKPDLGLYLAFGTLSIVGLAASLDATSISPALPVRHARVLRVSITNWI